MPRLSNILNDSDEAKIPVGNDDNGNPEFLTIEYFPSRLTPKLMAQMQQLNRQAEKAAENEAKQKEILARIYGLLLSFFDSWDMEDEFPCGKCEECKSNEECKSKVIREVPLNAETLDNLPYWLLREITGKFINPNQTAPQNKRKRKR